MVESYVADIMKALENKCWFSALALSLALPDICGAAEYPDESSVAKRYIDWFDKYLGDYLSDDDNAPYLSGEVVYNLRNTFLHSGNANVDGSKVKDETNQLDRFVLILGDGKKTGSMSWSTRMSGVQYRMMAVDVAYLCQTICNFSLQYYQQNPDKFHFDRAVVTQEHLLSASAEHANHDLKDLIHSVELVLSQKLNQREEQVRSFVGRHFKEEEYDGQKKERIIQAILQSRTKQQVNDALMRSFPSKETGAIYKRLSPLLTALPGN